MPPNGVPVGPYGQAGKTSTVDQVVKFMKDHYFFHAAPAEYRRHFREWNVGKRVVKDVKDDVVMALGKRKRPGTSTSNITIQDGDQTKPFKPSKLRRHMMSKMSIFMPPISPGILSSWNLPYAAFVSSLSKYTDEPSPFGLLGLTPTNINIQSPELLTPGREASAPSPNMQLVYQKAKENRVSLFLQGRLKELAVSMDQNDRRILFDYFHEFYLHSFTMAKSWRKCLARGGPVQAPPRWPGSLSIPPTQLCNWSIHGKPMINWVDGRYDVKVNGGPKPVSFVVSMLKSMTSNDFTGTPKADVPLAHEMIEQSFEQNQAPLQVDAWKLAIIAGNNDLLYEMFEQNNYDPPDGIEAIHPLHLAASHLDGGHTCCTTLYTLCMVLGPSYAYYHSTDDLGHTLMDAIMAPILRSHTNLDPGQASYGLTSPNRFPGEEKDICGRWNADSPEVQELFKEGYARIPTSWKHPFCHTSIQAVCHSLIIIYGSPSSPHILEPSGLFVRRCTDCGLELKLGPLHTLVVVAFYLAQSGMDGETLFGALAVMVCLLALGVDASFMADVSVTEIIGSAESGICHHAPLTALELVRAVPASVTERWSSDCQIGWACLHGVLAHVELFQARALDNSSPRGEEEDDDDESSSAEGYNDNDNDFESISFGVSTPYGSEYGGDESTIHEVFYLPCNDEKLGQLWATIQTELLTYRRVRESDPWLSEYFSMKELSHWMHGRSASFSTPLVQHNMVAGHWRCGWFFDENGFCPCPTAEQVCTRHFFTNMDQHERRTLIERLNVPMAWEL